VGPRAVLDTVVKRKIPSPRREWNPRTPIVQPVAQRFTDLVIISHTTMKGIREEILNYNRAMGIIRQVFRPNFVQINTRSEVHTTNADLMAAKLLRCVNEMKAESRLQKRNLGGERQVILGWIIETYRSTWGNHVLRMPRSRIPFQILRYQPK
jgi:hypothetical protein